MKHLKDLVKQGKILSVKVSCLFIGDVTWMVCTELLSLFLNISLLIHHEQIMKHVKNGKNVSSGYGFLEFDSVETATSVFRDLQVYNKSSLFET